MIIRDLFVREVGYFHMDTNLAAAAVRMWEGDCGVMPVVDSTRKVAGIVTNRDVCTAIEERDHKGALLKACDLMCTTAPPIHPSDTAEKALKIMRDLLLRGLPVVDRNRSLLGMLYLDDLILAAAKGGRYDTTGISQEEILKALKVLSAHYTQRRKAAAQHELAGVSH